MHALFGVDTGDVILGVVDIKPAGVRIAAGVEQAGLARAQQAVA
ncbi:MAG: hypothetical protein ACK4SX_15520 [Alcanivoracaceae bacterium]